MRVSTAEGTLDLKALRLAWKEPTIFSVSGVDLGHRPKRILLRFSNKDSAIALASYIQQIGQTVEVVNAPVFEEIPVLVRFSYSMTIVSLSIAATTVWVLLLFEADVQYGFIGLLVALWLLNFIPLVVLRPLISRFVPPLPGRLRLEDQRVVLSTHAEWFNPAFSSPEIRDPRTIVFRMGLRRVELQFSTDGDAAKALHWMRMRSPFPVA